MSKYNSKKVTRNGYTFDSVVEADYYDFLLTFKKKEEIKVHPSYVLIQGFKVENETIRPIKYEADFEIVVGGETHVVDIKGLATETAKLKRKLFLYTHKDKCLMRVVRYKGQWVLYHENEKRKKANKKAKLKA